MNRLIIPLILIFLSTHGNILFGQCNNPIQANLELGVGGNNFFSSVTLDMAPFENTCGCGSLSGCREVTINITHTTGTPYVCGILEIRSNRTFGSSEEFIRVIDPQTCQEVGGNPALDHVDYYYNTGSQNSSFTVLICQGPDVGSTTVTFSSGETCIPATTCENLPVDDELVIEQGDIVIEEACRGVVMKAPNGDCYRMVVDNNGDLSTQSVTCPN